MKLGNDRHEDDEGGGNEPKRAAAYEAGNDPQSDHRQRMIEPADRVHETLNDARRRIVLFRS